MESPERSREAARRSYQKHKHRRQLSSTWRAKNREAARRYYQKVQGIINAIKIERGCAECGYRKHPAALDFAHLDPFTKSFGVGFNASHALADVLAEIEKCRVLCANCHREETANDPRVHKKKLAGKSGERTDVVQPLPLFESESIN